MLEAVEILLKRMESHPEEFFNNSGYLIGGAMPNGKWNQVLQTLNEWATQEEIDSLKEGLLKARRSLVNEKVLKILAGEDSPKEDELPLYTTKHPNATQLGGATLGGLSGAGVASQQAYQQSILAQGVGAYFDNQTYATGFSVDATNTTSATTIAEPSSEFLQKLKEKLFEEAKK